MKFITYEEFVNLKNQPQTKTFWKFYVLAHNLIRIAHFKVSLAQSNDKQRVIIQKTSKAIMDIIGKNKKGISAGFHEEISNLLDEKFTDGPATEAVASIFYELTNSIFIRNIDNFKCYISRLMSDIFSSKTQMLISSEKVEISEVLKYQSREEFIQYYVDKKINTLTYKSLEDLNSYFKNKHNFIIIEDSNVSKLSEFFALRNLLVHNWGKIDLSFASKFKKSNYKIGETIENIPKFDEICRTLASIAKDLDDRAIEKYGLAILNFDENKAFPK